MIAAEPSVFVVDDDAALRKAVARLLKSAGFRVETLATAEDFLRRPVPPPPSCIVLDLCMPGLDGLELQRTLAERHSLLPIIFISGHGDIPTSVRAMKAGALDFLPKPFEDENLLAAVRRALGRHAANCQEQTEAEELRRRAGALSPRQREVMALVVTGMLNKQAGHQLRVSEKTIKAHRGQVMRKMKADSLADLVRMAQKLGVQ